MESRKAKDVSKQADEQRRLQTEANHLKIVQLAHIRQQQIDERRQRKDTERLNQMFQETTRSSRQKSKNSASSTRKTREPIKKSKHSSTKSLDSEDESGSDYDSDYDSSLIVSSDSDRSPSPPPVRKSKRDKRSLPTSQLSSVVTNTAQPASISEPVVQHSQFVPMITPELIALLTSQLSNLNLARPAPSSPYTTPSPSYAYGYSNHAGFSQNLPVVHRVDSGAPQTE